MARVLAQRAGSRSTAVSRRLPASDNRRWVYPELVKSKLQIYRIPEQQFAHDDVGHAKSIEYAGIAFEPQLP
jgi:hypothetical protein